MWRAAADCVQATVRIRGVSTQAASAGQTFRKLMMEAHRTKTPMQIVGATTPYYAMMAEKLGYKSVYVSGGGVALAGMGLPDLGITTLQDVLTDVSRLTRVCTVPALVDIDTGFGGGMFNIERTVRDMEKAGAGAVHMEDQVQLKRCGHRPNKQVVPPEEMVDRIKAAKQGAKDLVIVARTDALAMEPLDQVVQRAVRYVEEGGADCLFIEAVKELEQYRAFSEALPNVPLLANLTEFGKTPLWHLEELSAVGISLALYPLSAFRASSKAASQVYSAILKDGTNDQAQKLMHTRMETYEVIDYLAYEEKMDSDTTPRG